MTTEALAIPTLDEELDTVVLVEHIKQAAFLLRHRNLFTEAANQALKGLKEDHHVACLLVQAERACEEDEILLIASVPTISHYSQS